MGDDERGDTSSADPDQPTKASGGDGLIADLQEPEPGVRSDGSIPSPSDAGSLPDLVIPGRVPEPAPGASSSGEAPTSPPAFESAPDPGLPDVSLPVDTSYPVPGVLLDDRGPVRVGEPSAAADCSAIGSVRLQGQRTTLGRGVQLRVDLQGAAGLPLDAKAHENCVQLARSDGTPLAATVAGAPATNALTLLLVRPGQTEAEHALLADAALKLFMSRPAGERVALYRWGASLQQVIGFTNYRDSFSDALSRLGLADGEPLDAGVAVTGAESVLEDVADDAHAWVRSVVVIAPHVLASELAAYERGVNVLWAVNPDGISGFQFVPTSTTAPVEAMGQVSARLDALRQAGFVTVGVCGDGLVTPARAYAGLASAEIELKDALVEEQTEGCDVVEVRDFEFYDTRVVELEFDDEEQRSVYDQAVDERDDEVTFALTARLSPDHAPTPTVANLRGGTSLSQCPSNRMNFSIDFDGGRERFFFPEASGSVGSDEFYLTAMCLDPMYVNQLAMDRLMASLGMFVSGVRLVEVRVDGSSQGVYLLMEQVKEALIRTESGLMSVVRRRNGAGDVKFPGVDDPDGQELALDDFDALRNDAEGLSGAARLEHLAPRLDLHRYMFFAAVQSAIFNADWADEPTFWATATYGPQGNAPYFQVNGWDPDDVLLGECAHDAVLEDPFDLIGCAEHSLDKAIFGADRRAEEIVDDEVYALYVEALDVVLSHLTEERVGAFYDAAVAELTPFTQNQEIVDVMPDWRNQDDPLAAVVTLVSERKEAFAERRSHLLEGLASYRATH